MSELPFSLSIHLHYCTPLANPSPIFHLSNNLLPSGQNEILHRTILSLVAVAAAAPSVELVERQTTATSTSCKVGGTQKLFCCQDQPAISQTPGFLGGILGDLSTKCEQFSRLR